MRILNRRRSAAAPGRPISDGPPITRAAVLGRDLPGLRPSLAVSEGDRVRAGDALFTDRKRPEVAIVSPVSGIVESIQHGPRRTLSALVVRCDGSAPLEVAPGAVRETLLARGMWPAFVTRPYGRIPLPDASPDAVLVTATQAEPEAPDPRAIVEDSLSDFRAGAEALTELTEGPVYVCQGPGADLVSGGGRIDVARFADGRTSAHVHRLCRVGPGRGVWTIGYQDVIAVGHLMRTGRYMADRVVAVSGPEGSRLFRTVLGASLRDLTMGEGRAGRVLSGPGVGGREAAFLGRYHLQVTLDAPVHEEPSRLRPIIPVAALERALPIPTLPVPLMRALSVGDAETAERLGCLELVEEDMAPLSRICTSGADYGRLLRRVLDELAAA